jgi:flagellar hook protein FlgE
VPYVGEAYIKAEKVHFKYSDSCFKANPDDEIAAGFDYDRWAGGQEDIAYTYKWYTAKSNKYVVKITGNKATLKIGSKLNKSDSEAERSWSIVPFVKEKGKWVMADNIYPAD